MVKRLLIVFSFVLALFNNARAQCPQIYDYAGTLTNTPIFVYCQPGNYTMGLMSNVAWSNYTIDWGDGSPITSGVSNAANNSINHTYAATVGTFVITMTMPAAPCTLTMLVVMEQAVAAGAQNFGGVTTFCAPGTVTVTNQSTNVSPTTVFTWDWGDGTPIQTFDYTNLNQNVVHTFAAGAVPNCQRQITLKASNYCRPIPNPLNLFVDIYDLDPTAATPDKAIKCFPENSFTLTNTTTRQCFAQGNTFQRQEKWNLGDYWGRGYDSIIDWQPWPPTTPVVVSYTSGLGTYTFQLLDSNLCGVRAVTQTLSIVPPPTAGMIAPGGNICQNATVTFTNTSAAGYTYKWNFGTGAGFTNLGTGNKSVAYATPGTYTVRVVAQVTGGGTSCSDTASAVINVLAAPVANFTYTPATGCTSIAAVGFTDTSTDATAWSWAFGNGNVFSGQSPPSQSYPNTGLYTASLVVTGSTTCTHTRTANIIVRSTPVPGFPIFTNCVGAVSNFSNTSTVTGTTAISSYTWDFGDGTPTLNVANPSHTYTAAGTYTVKLIAATPFCSDSIFQTISINVKPTANFAFSPTVACPPFVSTFSNTTLNGVNYAWRFGTSPSATSTAVSPSHTYINTTQTIQNYTVALVSQTGAGCADSIKKVIAVYPIPVASIITNTNAGCPPLLISFTNTSIGAATYSWTFGDGGVSTQSNTTHSYTNNLLGPVNHTAQVIIENVYGCKDTTSIAIQVYGVPQASVIITPSAGCDPLTVNFASLPGISGYTWDFGDGSPLSNATSSITHTYYNSTSSNKTFTASLIASNVFGCVDTAYNYPLVYGKPVANYTHTPKVGCSPLVVSFTNTSTNNASNSWTFGNGQTSSAVDPTATYTNAPAASSQSFTIKLVITSAEGCKDSVEKQVKLFDHPQSVFTVDTPACSPKMITFFNSSIYANTYNWSFGDGSVSTQTIDITNYYVNNSAFNVTYNAQLITTSNDGCKDTLIVPIIVHPKPVFFINSQPDSGCTPLKVFFNKVVGVQLYQWNFGDGNMAISGDVSNLFVNNTPSDRIFNVAMIATDKYGCMDTATKKIKVFPKPTAAFNAEPLSVFIPNQATQCYNFSSGATTYYWRFGDGGVSTEKAPSHKYQQKGEYQISLLVTSNKGCVDSFALPAKVVALDETFVQMPNAFTPNPSGSPGGFYNSNDTNNDIFHPVIRGTETYVFSIFSRWGELLFETKNPDEGWDGYYKGKMCTQDVYIWKIAATFIDGKTYNKTGDVLLLK